MMIGGPASSRMICLVVVDDVGDDEPLERRRVAADLFRLSVEARARPERAPDGRALE